MCRIVIWTHTLAAAVAVAGLVGLSGCVGQAGIGADGSATAERETSIYRYTKALPDGSQVTAEAIIAKKAQVQGLEFRSRSDGSVVMLLESAESGDRQSDKALEVAGRALAMFETITGPGGRGLRLSKQEDRRTATEKRREARAEQRRVEAESQRLKSLESTQRQELALISARAEEAARHEAEARAAAEEHAE